MPSESLFRRVAPLLVRGVSTLGGGAILYHEVYIAQTAEPLLVFVGLWLAGAPIADLLDKLRRLAMTVNDEPVPQVPEPPKPPELP
jgi:hypothetical protein